MPSTIMTAALVGLECEPIEVQCDAGSGQFYFCIVGLPDTAVQESRERVRSAIKNSGFHFPRGRVTVNLAPADIKKEGPAYDMPIAVSILLAGGTILTSESLTTLTTSLFIGELSLEGQCRSVHGILSVVLMAKKRGVTHVYVPQDNAREAALIEGVTVYPVASLHALVQHLSGHSSIEPYIQTNSQEDEPSAVYEIDISAIKGQEHAKRVLEIAAAGGHNLLFNGPPGSGKTLLARMMPSLLPRLTLEESLEVTRLYSVAGLLSPQTPLMRVRPFRSPHHTSSAVALVGGGSWPRPGEMSLAHRGVLFMDEFPEFPRNVLEALRQPLEDGVVTVSRSNGSVTFPARCMLVAAQNPCPCG
ncbi:YifB family Mg chelatase-like AAA ATPase, partial [Candidatus Uhrbacteria bacterium]|nr:YifB family Mg chelatase-like AAA ATPase [Candidatus Uhrbacteria bacterium]